MDAAGEQIIIIIIIIIILGVKDSVEAQCSLIRPSRCGLAFGKLLDPAPNEQWPSYYRTWKKRVHAHALFGRGGEGVESSIKG